MGTSNILTVYPKFFFLHWWAFLCFGSRSLLNEGVTALPSACFIFIELASS